MNPKPYTMDIAHVEQMLYEEGIPDGMPIAFVGKENVPLYFFERVEETYIRNKELEKS